MNREQQPPIPQDQILSPEEAVWKQKLMEQHKVTEKIVDDCLKDGIPIGSVETILEARDQLGFETPKGTLQKEVKESMRKNMYTNVDKIPMEDLRILWLRVKTDDAFLDIINRLLEKIQKRLGESKWDNPKIRGIVTNKCLKELIGDKAG